MNGVEKRIFDILLPYFQHQELMLEKEYIQDILRTRLIEENINEEELNKLLQQEESLKSLIKSLNDKKKSEVLKIDELVMSQEKYKIEENEFNKKIQELKKKITENEEIFSEQSEIINALKEKLLKENKEIKKLNGEKEKNIEKISELELDNSRIDEEIKKIIVQEIGEQLEIYKEKVKIYQESKEHLESLEELKDESLSDTYKEIEDSLSESGNGAYQSIQQRIDGYKDQIKETREQVVDTYEMINQYLSKIDPNFERITTELYGMYEVDKETKKDAKMKAENLAEHFKAKGKVKIGIQSVSIR